MIGTEITQNCEYCAKPFTQVTGRHPKRRFCTKQCNYNSLYHRNKEYYKNRYEGMKSKVLASQREYRSDPRVKKLRDHYAEQYKEKDQAKRRERYRGDEVFRNKNKSRVAARIALAKLEPGIACCHCGSTGRVNCHHINENCLDNSDMNLCWLCSGCHGKIHSIVHMSEVPQIAASISQSVRLRINSKKPIIE